MLPVEIAKAFDEIFYSEEECPGVYYVSARTSGEAAGGEYYIVTEDSPAISSEGKSYGKPFFNALMYHIGEDGSGDRIVEYEMKKYCDQHGIVKDGNDKALDIVMFSREQYPNYFGMFPAPCLVLDKAVMRYKVIINGVFLVETEDYRRHLAVSYPIWEDISAYTIELAKQDKDYAFFNETSACLALFELIVAHREIMKSPYIDMGALMNAIWTYYPEYAMCYNLEEQQGKHDVLSALLSLFGENVVPCISQDNMIALSTDRNCDYIRM